MNSYHGSLADLAFACARNPLDLEDFSETYGITYEEGHTFLAAKVKRSDLLQASFMADEGLWGSSIWICKFYHECDSRTDPLASRRSAKWLEVLRLLDPAALSGTFYGLEQFDRTVSSLIR